LYSLRSELAFTEPVNNHTFVLRVTPMVEPSQQTLRITLTSEPECKLASYIDAFGNTVHEGYLEESHSAFIFNSTGEVLVDSTKKDTTPPAPYYYMPTKLTEVCGGLQEFVDGVEVFDRPQKTTEEMIGKLGDTFHYEKGHTTTATSATQAWEIGAGVCQDFTHIAIATLRHKGIPCRYVAGLLVGEGASHAWVEVFDGKEWVAFDPTHRRVCDETYMKISHGPDFSECALERGVFMGNGKQEMTSKCALLEI
ncbi:MAG: transglutaminase family protein, partial [Burkholderiales bacterium]|nr:transglutaminase family protein [Burkholderiales bacterium]